MADLARLLFWFGLASTGLALVLHWIYQFGVRLFPVSRFAAETSAGQVTVATPGTPSMGIRRLSLVASASAFAILTGSLAARTAADGHAPLSNMYEYSTAFAWAISGYALAFELKLGRRWPGTGALPIALIMLLVAASFPSRIEPLQPALQNSPLLAIHVSMMVLAYSAFSIAFAASALYLVQGGKRRFESLPSGKSLDEAASLAVMIGFPLLGFGIALGAWWANSAWGRYWGWDPKETSALATWLLFAAYLHAHSLGRWKGKRSAWLVVVGFGAVLFTYYAVNLWVAGLHSYAGV